MNQYLKKLIFIYLYMISLNIDYKKNSTYLCELGKKFDTDKSSQRNNISDSRHSHPYTILYDSLFKNKQNENIKIAELGILHGSSLLMWKEYFKKGLIYGFDNNDELIINFKKNYNDERIFLNKLNIKNKNDINDIFNNLNILFDIIIDDTTHEFEDLIKFIQLYSKVMADDGILIIEDIQSVDWIEILLCVVPDELKKFIMIYDLRQNKERYDDLVFTIDKLNID